MDDVTSYGPETITILSSNNSFTPGNYRYSLHHYTDSDLLIENNTEDMGLFRRLERKR